MEARNFVLSGGAATITAPGGATVLRIIGTAAFNVTYADFSAGGRRVGSAAPAVAFGSNYIFDVLAPLGSAFSLDQTIAYVSGGGVQTVSVVPVINANKPVVLQTDGSTNGDQSKLNIVGTGQVTATDDGSGAVTVNVPKEVSINSQAGDYTLALSDSGKYVRMTKGTANNLTVPANGTVAFPVGTSIAVRQAGAGVTTLVAAGGVTLNNPGTDLHFAKQNATCQLIKVASDTWDIVGGTTGA